MPGSNCQLFQKPWGSIETTILLARISLRLSSIRNWGSIESGVSTVLSIHFFPNIFFKRLGKIVTLTDCPSDASNWATRLTPFLKVTFSDKNGM